MVGEDSVSELCVTSGGGMGAVSESQQSPYDVPSVSRVYGPACAARVLAASVILDVGALSKQRVTLRRCASRVLSFDVPPVMPDRYVGSHTLMSSLFPSILVY